ncbi:phosphoribosyl transferase domain protein [Teratosphaeria destructans]|uniref:Phosphoribosyl transferase domain protein n=1 Tax=Teratosphaeria destructans TaxID=418781 RepID=A0A9W7T0S2_9PEZI|nr:phosphoribosyl transferase domain protein [Teratosphaeria destructans]
MATLDELKAALNNKASDSQRRPLSAEEYRNGFDVLSRGSAAYQDFFSPQLAELLTPLFHARLHVSVLEIGPGPKSVLGLLPDPLRRKIRRYTAFEIDDLYASHLNSWIRPKHPSETPFPGLDSPPEIFRTPFTPSADRGSQATSGSDGFDLVLFCHSMYGMTPKRAYVEAALNCLRDKGKVIVCHRDSNLYFDGLVSSRTFSFPTATVNVADDDATLDTFASFIASHELHPTEHEPRLRRERRQILRTSDLGECDSTSLTFRSPNAMVVFNQHAAKLPELLEMVPSLTGQRKIKNPEARHSSPASIVQPATTKHIQSCIQWALQYGLNMTVFGGGHSGQCLRSNVVAIDMSSFKQVDFVRNSKSPGTVSLAVVQIGCTSGDIVSKAMDQNVTVPLGARPSVGAGLWLQGGIGHLSRSYGLGCDSVVGAVLICAKTARILVVGKVPATHIPAHAVRPRDEHEILWGLKGAGSNFGIIVSVVFKTYPASLNAVQNWITPPSSTTVAASQLLELDKISLLLSDDCSLDAFLYHQEDQLHIGATLFRPSSSLASGDHSAAGDRLSEILGPQNEPASIANSVQLFDADMYVSAMHGGHGGGKTSSFKRCVFLKSIGESEVINAMLAALKSRPSVMSYMHLLHGGGAIARAAGQATAFGCRDWQYACVITGVWAREADGSSTALEVVQWVYDTAQKLLPSSVGVYGADLGPDPRDASLANVAFGRNATRLARLKGKMDPHSILPYACPLPQGSHLPKVIVLVTGEICAGKDFCADLWAAVFRENGLQASVASISDVTKKEYAAATGASIERLLADRAYKEQHRPALTAFYHHQVSRRPWLPEEHFLHVAHSAAGVDVLLITGMRDKAPVTSLSHLVSHSRVLEVRVHASAEIRQKRGPQAVPDEQSTTAPSAAIPHPDFSFSNDEAGPDKAKRFAADHFLTFFDGELDRLTTMVRSTANFPITGVNFRHVLDICQQPGGLPVCTSLLQRQFSGDWSEVEAVVSCEAGGLLFASPLAAQINRPLALVREAGKLPPPVVLSPKDPSNISAFDAAGSRAKTMVMARGVISEGGSAVVVDDVLASGKTLCAVLQLLAKNHIRMENVRVMVVAEFPMHRGREYLMRQGFGDVRVQSLLVFGGL